MTFPDEQVVKFVTEHFVPWRIDYKQDLEHIRQYNVFTTPTMIFADPKGGERFRSTGYLPPDRFLGRCTFGLAWVALMGHEYALAGDIFEQFARGWPNSENAAQAIYFKGVSRDKLTGDHSNRRQIAHELREDHPDSDWSQSASVWYDAKD